MICKANGMEKIPYDEFLSATLWINFFDEIDIKKYVQLMSNEFKKSSFKYSCLNCSLPADVKGESRQSK